MPVEEFGTKLNTLPKGKEILAYCRGPYCLLSHSAVEQLRSKGFRAKRWLSGPPEWITDGIRSKGASVGLGTGRHPFD